MPVREALACALLLVACRGGGPAHPPAAVDTPPPACSDPAESFAAYAWLPTDAHALVSVQLHDSGLPAALARLEEFALGPFVRDDSWTRFAAELPDLRALLTTARLDPSEAVYVLRGGDIGVWAVPGVCEPDELERIAAALGLVLDPVEGLPSARIAAPRPRAGRALVQLSPGGPLWIGRVEAVDALSTRLKAASRSHHELFAAELRDSRRRSTVRVCAYAESRYTRYDVSEAGLAKSGFIDFVAPVTQAR